MKMENLISVKKEKFNFPDDKDFPQECKQSIFIPGISAECMHYYFLANYKTREITCWTVDLKKVNEFILSNLDENKIGAIPWNQDSLKRFVEVIHFAHSAEYYQGRIYVSFIEGNFILALNLEDDSYEMIYDESSLNKIYSSTNRIHDGKIYFTRWDLNQTFIHENDRMKLVDLEIGTYDINKKEFEIIDKIKGHDDIHSTDITTDGKNVLLVEMSQDPVIKPPKDYEIEHLSVEKMKEILSGRIKESDLITYNLEKKQYHTLKIEDGPAHIVRDDKEENVYYLSSHNLSTNNNTLYCFGSSRIDKVKVVDGQSEIVGNYQEDDLLRAPSHNFSSYKGKRFMPIPVFPNQVHIIDVDKMENYKKIKLRASKEQPNFDKGPFKYPKVNADKTPYTICPIENTPYMYLSSVWNISVYDFENNEQLISLRYNKNKPITSMGHASMFEI